MPNIDSNEIKKFQKEVWRYYATEGRTFPWRKTKNPYFILVSEIMLQQTQADRVIRYYEAFIKKFPTPEKLAKAKFSDIYPLWQGLGYNRRALNLKRAAEKSVTEYDGTFPQNPNQLLDFTGIGPYTARAVSIFAFNTPVACIETNIRRVFIHHFFKNKKSITDEQIQKVADVSLDTKKSREWHWALMDYGAYLKTIIENPNRRHKNYSVQSKFEGSERQARGMILKMLSAKRMGIQELVKLAKRSNNEVEKILLQLEKEGLVIYDAQKKTYLL